MITTQDLGTVTLAGATTQNYDIDVPAGMALSLIYAVIAIDPSAAARDKHMIMAAGYARPTASALVLIGGAGDNLSNRGGASTGVYSVSGNNARFAITGVAGQNIRFRVMRMLLWNRG